MMTRQGKRTVVLKAAPAVLGCAATVGKKEKEGPLGDWFQYYDMDTTFSQDSWEKAESELQKRTLHAAMERAQLREGDVDLLFGGDLLNQCIASGYASREADIPFAGLFGACSTMALSTALASLAVDGGYARRAAAITSSHFCAAERQFRFPLEYGGQRAPASQWTVTGSGCIILGPHSSCRVTVRRVCFGAVKDLGVCDMNNMGCAMAPAAADTLMHFLRDTDRRAKDYTVVTGDLGHVGASVFRELCERGGYPLGEYLDCGRMIYDAEAQGVYSGGSGCGCSASVLCAHLLPRMEKGELGEVLFMATGALMSPTSFQQGESIPAIAHLVQFSPPDRNV